MPKTYIPSLSSIAQLILRYAGKYNKTIEKNLHPFVYTVWVLLIDIGEILIAVLELQTPDHAAYDPDIPLDSSGYINQIRGAFDKFFASNGIEGGS